MTHIPTAFIIDDEQGMRNALQRVLMQAGIAALPFASADAFLQAYQPETPGCLLLDQQMPGMSGLELQQLLNERHVRIPIIFVTGSGSVPMAVSAMRSGAVDVIEKPFENAVLIERVRKAIASDLLSRRNHAEQTGLLLKRNSLTPREREVMDLLVAGHANKSIGSELGISTRTVEVHRARVMEKMGVRSLPELVRMAMESDGEEPAG